MNPHFNHVLRTSKSLVIPNGHGEEPYQDLSVTFVADQPLELSLADSDDVMVMVVLVATNRQIYVDAKYLAHSNCSDCEHVWKSRKHDIDGLDDAPLFVPLALQSPTHDELMRVAGDAPAPPLLAHIHDIPAVQAALSG